MRSTSPSAAVVVVKLDDWGSGTQANITVKNNTTAPISSWSVTVPASNTINSSWDCDVATIDGFHTFENKNWNGAIPAGGSVTFGVIFAGSFKQPATDLVFFDARRVTVSGDTPAPDPDPQPDPPKPEVPAKPANLRAFSQTAGAVVAMWDASPTATSYTVAAGGQTVVVTGTQSILNGLTPDTDVLVTVVATNEAGNSAPAGVTVHVMGGAADKPAKVTNLRAVSNSAGAVDVTWTPSAKATSYSVSVADQTMAVGGGTSSSASFTGLVPDTDVLVTVFAQSPQGVSDGATTQVHVKGSTPPPPPPAGDKIGMAYAIQWGAYGRKYFPSNIDATKLTHVTYAFANISAAGEVVSGDSYADWEMTQDNQKWDDPDKGNFGGLHRLRAAHPHLKLILSVGGWTWSDHFTVAAASTESRKRFAASAVDFLDKHGFDGLDLDWEYPQGGGQAAGRPEDRANLTLLLAECRAQLDALGARKGQQYTLSMAVGMGPSIIGHYDAAALAKYCDWVGLMAYDYHGGFENKTGANAPLYAATGDTPGFNIDAGVKTWIAAGLPAEKMLMGIGFYGRGWSGVDNPHMGQPAAGPLSPGTWENGVFDFTDLQDNYIGKGDWTVTRDTSTQTPFLYSPSRRAFISYDDEWSVNTKCDYVLEKGMKGTLVWELSGDRKNTLLSILAKRLLK